MEWDKLNKEIDKIPQEPQISQPLRVGLIILFVFVGGFLLWSILFPLDEAAVANGEFVVVGERKTIQHLEGGVIKKIYIDEGDTVKAGQTLIKLDDTQAQATVDLLNNQQWDALANESRIFAELAGDKTITFPDELLSVKDNPKVKKIINAQEKLFAANNNSYQGQIDVLNQRIAEYNKQIDSYNAQVKANADQLTIINQELKAVQYLADKHLIDKPRLYALQRKAAQLLGNRDEYLGMIAKAHQGIGETKSQIYALIETRRRDLLEKLNDEQEKLSDAQEKIRAASDVLARTLITAPKAGVILNLKTHTVGGVVTPGQTICEIVPSNTHLILEVKISPTDIDVVKEGLPAKIRLTAYKQRIVPTFDGSVSEVSADALEDPQTHIRYYLAKIQFTPEASKEVKKIKIYPGMPAQAMIIVAHRTALDYLIRPFLDNFNKAFREQ